MWSLMDTSGQDSSFCLQGSGGKCQKEDKKDFGYPNNILQIKLLYVETFYIVFQTFIDEWIQYIFKKSDKQKKRDTKGCW